MKKQISELLFNRFLNKTLILPEYKENATAEWIQKESGLPWLPLEITVPVQPILTEIQNIKHLLTTHRDNYSENFGWSSFCLHGKSYDATREDEYYNDTRPHAWTPESQDLMPQTVEFFNNNWPTNKFARLRVMRLAPGGWIAVHSDTNIKGLQPVNIAITQPNDCAFVMEHHGRVPFDVGTALLLDVSNMHTVFNNSDQDRWHLIVHQQGSQEFDNLVKNSYNKFYNKIK